MHFEANIAESTSPETPTSMLTRKLEEAQRTIDVLNARVTELQTLASSVENERRMWKHRASTLHMLLVTAVIELPIAAQEVFKAFGPEVEPAIERSFAEAMKKIDEVAKRNALLEGDAWCKAVNVAREFIKDAEQLLAPSEFVSSYVERFKNAFG